MKYVMFEEPSGIRYPIVFSELINHSTIVRGMHSQYPGIKPISAGFCNRHGQAWGKSVTLDLKSNVDPSGPPDDVYYLKKMFDIED